MDSTVTLRRCKPKIIEALGSDPDFILQHADSLDLLSCQEYRRIKAAGNPSEKARDLLDCVLDKGCRATTTLLELLQKPEIQETYPQLGFLREGAVQEAQRAAQQKGNNKIKIDEVTYPTELEAEPGSALVTEKQLMRLAGALGHEWKQVGRQLLGLGSVRLEQCEEENPHCPREAVFAMLRTWRTRERWGATAGRLHALLSQDDSPLHPETYDFLLDPP
ncbi:uncharacterized protein LOC136752835 isoform X2 [Amia ocellicauda]